MDSSPFSAASAAAAGAAPTYMEADLERSRLYRLAQMLKGLVKFRPDR